MEKTKNILVAVGICAIALFIVLLVIGIKVVSTVLVYILGILAVIALIGFIVYYGRKLFSGRDRSAS